MVAPLGARAAQDAVEVETEADAPEDAPRLEVSGKLFARAQADQRDEYARDLSVPMARVQVDASFGFAQAVMEADLASKALVKDAYLRLRDPSKHARLYVGQFKAPFLQRALESRWDLPLISRGLVADYLTDRNGLGGRRLGVMGELRWKHLSDLTVQLGAFQGEKDELGKRLGEDASARVSVEPWKFLSLGVSSYVSDALGAQNRVAFSADATATVKNARLSLEGTAGRLPLGRFTGGIALASYRFLLGESAWALEPLFGAEVLQLRGAQSGQGQAAVVGTNVHFGDRLKLQVQAERGLFPGDAALQNRFSAQLGARF